MADDPATANGGDIFYGYDSPSSGITPTSVRL